MKNFIILAIIGANIGSLYLFSWLVVAIMGDKVIDIPLWAEFPSLVIIVVGLILANIYLWHKFVGYYYE